MLLTPEDLEARVIYEDHGVLAVDKCPDLPTSGRSLDDEDCLQFALMRRHGGMVWAVHQLDADTSGVNVFTTEKRLVAVLKDALSDPSAAKHYVAYVHGTPSWEEHTATAPIGSIDDEGKRLGVCANGKHATTHFQVIKRFPRHAQISASPVTGRTHQIRIHAAALGHTLVGEGWYGEAPCTLHPRQALHASMIVLRPRWSGPARLILKSPMPADLVGLYTTLESAR